MCFRISFFFCLGCFVMYRLMGSLCIIEINISIYRRSEFPFRAVFVSIQFFSFHRSEESLHYGVIIRNARFGERLSNLSSLQIIAKSSRPVVASLIRMEDQTRLRFPGFICHSKSFFNQMCIVAVSNLVGNHPPGVEIHDNTNKVLHLIKAIVGHITHPNLIWSLCCETSLYYVLAFSCFIIMALFDPIRMLCKSISRINSRTNSTVTRSP